MEAIVHARKDRADDEYNDADLHVSTCSAATWLETSFETHVVAAVGNVAYVLVAALDGVEPAREAEASDSAHKVASHARLVNGCRGWERPCGREDAKGGEVGREDVEREKGGKECSGYRVRMNVDGLVVDVCPLARVAKGNTRQESREAERFHAALPSRAIARSLHLATLTSDRRVQTRADAVQLGTVPAKHILVVALPWHEATALLVVEELGPSAGLSVCVTVGLAVAVGLGLVASLEEGLGRVAHFGI